MVLSDPEEENDGIVYKAAAEQLEEDLEKDYQLDTFVIEKGTYKYITISNYKSDPQKYHKCISAINGFSKY